MYYKDGGVSISDILTIKSEEGPQPYCKSGAKLEGNSWPGFLVKA